MVVFWTGTTLATGDELRNEGNIVEAGLECEVDALGPGTKLVGPRSLESRITRVPKYNQGNSGKRKYTGHLQNNKRFCEIRCTDRGNVKPDVHTIGVRNVDLPRVSQLSIEKLDLSS